MNPMPYEADADDAEQAELAHQALLDRQQEEADAAVERLACADRLARLAVDLQAAAGDLLAVADRLHKGAL